MVSGTQAANYLAALILGQKDEIPIQIEGRVEFVSSEAALKADPEQSAPAGRFLTLRHLLRIRNEGESLQQQIIRLSTIVEDFNRQLVELCETDDDCHRRITGIPLVETMHSDPATVRPQTIALLDELAAQQDWAALEEQASRHMENLDPRLARIAKTHLAQALMHSDEQHKREEAAALSEQLVVGEEATVQDYLLTAGASEAAGLSPRSIELMSEALGTWPGDAYLLDYARGLATRTGDAALRSLTDAQSGAVEQ